MSTEFDADDLYKDDPGKLWIKRNFGAASILGVGLGFFLFTNAVKILLTHNYFKLIESANWGGPDQALVNKFIIGFPIGLMLLICGSYFIYFLFLRGFPEKVRVTQEGLTILYDGLLRKKRQVNVSELRGVILFETQDFEGPRYSLSIETTNNQREYLFSCNSSKLQKLKNLQIEIEDIISPKRKVSGE